MDFAYTGEVDFESLFELTICDVDLGHDLGLIEQALSALGNRLDEDFRDALHRQLERPEWQKLSIMSIRRANCPAFLFAIPNIPDHPEIVEQWTQAFKMGWTKVDVAGELNLITISEDDRLSSIANRWRREIWMNL